MFIFGSGNLYAVGPDGPVKFGVLQESSVDMSFTVKELHGQHAFPVDVARGKGKIAIKAKTATISADFFNAIFLNGDLSAGHVALVEGEAVTLPDPAPAEKLVVNAATFKADLGVMDATTGKNLKRVAANPAAGEYSVTAAGLYGFDDAMAGKRVKIAYEHSVAGSGKTIKFTNPLLGNAPSFQLHLYGQKDGKAATLVFYRAMSTKLLLAQKQEDYAIPEFDISVFAADNGDVFDWYFTE